MPTGINKKENTYPVQQLSGQFSNAPESKIKINEFSSLVNMDFTQKTLGSRSGYSEFVTGLDGTVIFGFEFKKSTDSSPKIFYVTSTRKWYTTDGSGGSLSSATTLPTGSGTISKVKGDMLGDVLYFTDEKYLYSYDGSTVTEITSNLPVSPAVGDPIDVATVQNRLFVATKNDYIVWSVPGDPNDLTTTANGAGSLQMENKDGMRMKSLNTWGSTIIVIKGDDSTFRYATYWLQGIGTSSDPYYYEALFGDSKSPTGFLGKSASRIGNDIIGLTYDGVTTISAINNFQKADGDLVSNQITDIIKRINWSQPQLINSIYDNANGRYMLGVPLGSDTSVTYILVYDDTLDVWSTYTGIDARSWFIVGRSVCFGTTGGKVYILDDSTTDNGNAFTWSAKTANNLFDQPDTIKLFKSVELDLFYLSGFTLNVDFEVDGKPLDRIMIPLESPASLWDVFVWDVDSWDGEGSKKITVYVMARGKSLKVTISSGDKDSKVQLNGITYRTVEKEGGTSLAT